MKNLLICSLLLLSSFLFWQCEKDNNEQAQKPTYTLKFSETTLTIPQVGGIDTIGIESPGHWSISFEYPDGAAADWLSVNISAGKPGIKKLALISQANPNIEDREATVVLSTMTGERTTMKVIQSNAGFFIEQKLFKLNPQDTTITIKFTTNLDFTVATYPVNDWIVQVMPEAASKATKYELLFKISANPKKLERSGTITLMDNNGSASETIDIVQAGLPDGGVMLYSGTDLLSNASFIRNSDKAIDSWFLRQTITEEEGDPVHIGPTKWWYAIPPKEVGGVRQEFGTEKYTFDGKDFALYFHASSGVQGLCLRAFGSGSFQAMLYAWDTDYETTVAGKPIVDETISLSGSEDAWPNLANGQMFPAGNYLYVFKAAAQSCGIWVTDYPDPLDHVHAYIAGQKSTKLMSLSYDAGTAHSMENVTPGMYGYSSVAKVSSSDNGLKWGAAQYFYSLNSASFFHKEGTDYPLLYTDGLSAVQLAGAYTMALSNKDGGVYMAVMGTDGKWTLSAKLKPTGKVASLVVKGGTAYLYTIKDGSINVATASTGSGAWYGSLADGGSVLALPAGVTDASAAYNSSTGKFVILCVEGGKIQSYVSADGISAFVKDALLLEETKAGASVASFIADENGNVATPETPWIGYKFSEGIYALPL